MMETSFRLLQSILFQSIANFHLQAPSLHLTGNIFHSQLYQCKIYSLHRLVEDYKINTDNTYEVRNM